MRIISTARHRLMGSRVPATSSVVSEGCNAPKISRPTLLPTASQRSGVMVRTKAATVTKITPSRAATCATICRGEAIICPT